MPLKGIRARATRHGESISALKADVRLLLAAVSRQDLRITKCVAKINEILAYEGMKRQ